MINVVIGFGLAGSAAANAAADLELPPGFSLWQKSLNLRVGAGYKDNVTLSSLGPRGSAFEIASAEAMLLRLPWDDWQFSLLALGSDARYFDRATGVDTEQNAAATAQFTWFPAQDWQSISTLQYTFVNQVMDVSTTYGTNVRQQVLGHGIMGKQGVRREFGRTWGEVTFAASRHFFREPLDDYWQFGPQLTVGRRYGQGSEVALNYQVMPVLYDTRVQAGRDGSPVAGSSLRFVPHMVELAWQQYWDKRRHWRSTTRFNFEVNHDNGSGYFDYCLYRVVEQLRYRPANWELSAQVTLAYYDFPHQPVSLTDLRSRHRTAIILTLRGERNLSRHWKVFAGYDYERSLSNLDVEEYTVNTASAGFEYAF